MVKFLPASLCQFKSLGCSPCPGLTHIAALIRALPMAFLAPPLYNLKSLIRPWQWLPSFAFLFWQIILATYGNLFQASMLECSVLSLPVQSTIQMALLERKLHGLLLPYNRCLLLFLCTEKKHQTIQNEGRVCRMCSGASREPFQTQKHSISPHGFPLWNHHVTALPLSINAPSWNRTSFIHVPDWWNIAFWHGIEL